MALVYHRLGMYKKSINNYEEALKILIKKLGTSHHLVKTI
jgi:hypothetical protein